MKHILIILLVCYFTVIGYAQDAPPIKAEILLNNALLEELKIDTQFIHSIEYTSGSFLLLSSSEQFYILGIGGIAPIFESWKSKIGIESFTVTEDTILLIVSGNSLYQASTNPEFVKIMNIPDNNMGISSKYRDVYVFDRALKEDKKDYFIYQISRDKNITPLVKIPTPVLSVFELPSQLFFSTKNILFCIDVKTKNFSQIFALPFEDDIISIAGDTINHTFYFSTAQAIYQIKNSNIEIISNDFGGILRYDGEGLLVFNPEKSLIIRLRNNILYPSNTTQTSNTYTPPPLKEVSKQITALNYLTPLKDLVTFFNNRRVNFENQVNTWTTGVNSYIRTMNLNYEKILKAEDELKKEKDKNLRGGRQAINSLQKSLNEQKQTYKASVKAMKTEGKSISDQLKTLKKQELIAIHNKFKDVISNVVPIYEFPALSRTEANIIFSNHIDSVQTVSYLRPANQLFCWYQNTEHSFYQIIEDNNQHVNRIIEKDKNLDTQLKSQNEQLSAYKIEPKKNRQQIRQLEKEISHTEKERYDQVKQMNSNSKELSNKLRKQDKEIKQAFNKKVEHVIEDIQYLFKQISEK